MSTVGRHARQSKGQHQGVRSPVPDWAVEDSGDTDTRDALGEQTEWGWAIPLAFRSLAGPPGLEPLPAPPGPGDPHASALGYWAALLHALVYSLGWARPDRGLHWWYEAGRPVDDDPRLRLLATYDGDGMLDLFAAWLWTTCQHAPVRHLSDLTGYRDDRQSVTVDEAIIREARRALADLRTWAPFGGGGDPLHLSMHCSGPLEPIAGSASITHTDRHRRSAVLVLDSMRGWYRALAEFATDLPDIGDRSWHVDVVVRPTGWLGTFRKSRQTQLWFAGPHRYHVPGA